MTSDDPNAANPICADDTGNGDEEVLSQSMPDGLLVVSDEEAGQRLDRFLVSKTGEISRTRLQALIKGGFLTRMASLAASSGEPLMPDSIGDCEVIDDPGQKVRLGERYSLQLPPPVDAAPLPEAIDLDIIFEDPHVIVVNKPAGLVVHPAPGHSSGTLVNALLDHCGDSLSGVGGVRRPGIVHRLDKDTSGLLVVAKSDAAHQGLSAQFQAHGRDGRLSRRYLALVWGEPPLPVGVIEAPLGRAPNNRLKMAVLAAPRGRPAVTRYKVLKRFGTKAGKPLVTLVACELETGRTHQIRVHMAHIKHPLLGDITYGAGFASSCANLTLKQAEALRTLHRQALHATHLGFEHPITGEQMAFDAEPPSDLNKLIRSFSS